MKIKLDLIEMDTSIQCRASIDTAVVNDYAERMQEGDSFPPVELYGNEFKYWIGDGWHRIMAAKQIGSEEIAANTHTGNRVDALKCALGANVIHGHRRTNADKRRCVEIALTEFTNLSSRAIADICGVSDPLVSQIKNQVLTISTCNKDDNNQQVISTKVTGADGKQYRSKNTPKGKTSSKRKSKIKVEPLSKEYLEAYEDYKWQIGQERKHKLSAKRKEMLEHLKILKDLVEV